MILIYFNLIISLNVIQYKLIEFQNLKVNDSIQIQSYDIVDFNSNKISISKLQDCDDLYQVWITYNKERYLFILLVENDTLLNIQKYKVIDENNKNNKKKKIKPS
jgi:hypothetical protein